MKYLVPASQYQRGIGLPAAIFVITVMATLAVAINWLVTQNAQTFDEEVRLTRAYYAAESGIGFMMNTLYPPYALDPDDGDDDGGYPRYTAGQCPATAVTYDFSVDGLNACSAEVTCTEDATVDDQTFYTLESTGSCGDVSRSLMVRSAY